MWGQLRLTGSAAGYFENCWLWVADHIFDTGETISVDSPRGALIQSTGEVLMMGVASEHSSLYQCDSSIHMIATPYNSYGH